MLNTSQIYEYPFRNPQKNFSGGNKRPNPEAMFAEQFARSYRDRFSQIHSGTCKDRTLFVREVPVSGNGIADLLVFSWSNTLTPQESISLDLEQLDPTVRAFEFKLSDWRKGMMQAHRYKYFSNASILVLPRNKMKSVKPELDLFRKLRVGLWGFLPETGSITCFYTPRPKQQQITKHAQKAIRLASQAVCS
ncbi:MAG: hypothetical protein ISS65_14070 [Desulfobacterales bacterium]|uniref:Uncharacterized protein n=1 Tax=Candidatus Desulfatibia profunda TaxID=2841695 RepID=A0A8J6NLF9_9BACT|nr:hypothetical protein [Candidatus Desulfatibia profunda]MBL7181312.1 hypothetical protein [Desulfobacterales bacterium]